MALTGKDLLNKLLTLTDEELEQPVYVYADHGQEHYRADTLLVGETTTELEYCLEDYFVHPEDRAGYEGIELKKFIEIS